MLTSSHTHGMDPGVMSYEIEVDSPRYLSLKYKLMLSDD